MDHRLLSILPIHGPCSIRVLMRNQSKIMSWSTKGIEAVVHPAHDWDTVGEWLDIGHFESTRAVFESSYESGPPVHSLRVKILHGAHNFRLGTSAERKLERIDLALVWVVHNTPSCVILHQALVVPEDQQIISRFLPSSSPRISTPTKIQVSTSVQIQLGRSFSVLS